MAPFGKIYSYPVSTTSFLPGAKTKAKTKDAVVPHHRLFLALRLLATRNRRSASSAQRAGCFAFETRDC